MNDTDPPPARTDPPTARTDPPTARTDPPTARYRVRTHARERALKILFQADVRGVDMLTHMERVAGSRAELDLLDDLDLADAADLDEAVARARAAAPTTGLHELTIQLVEGVAAHVTTIDGILDRFANHWSVPRMPRVDRNILRIGVFELLGSNTPNPVVIDEMLLLSSAFAGDRTGPFVNGVLESVRRASERGGLRLDDVARRRGGVEPAPLERAGTPEPGTGDEQTGADPDQPDRAAPAGDEPSADVLAALRERRSSASVDDAVPSAAVADDADEEALALLDVAEADPVTAEADAALDAPHPDEEVLEGEDVDDLGDDGFDADLDLLLDEFDDLAPETEIAILLGDLDDD